MLSTSSYYLTSLFAVTNSILPPLMSCYFRYLHSSTCSRQRNGNIPNCDFTFSCKFSWQYCQGVTETHKPDGSLVKLYLRTSSVLVKETSYASSKHIYIQGGWKWAYLNAAKLHHRFSTLERFQKLSCLAGIQSNSFDQHICGVKWVLFRRKMSENI